MGQQRHVETSARLRTLLDETDFAVALAAGASMRLSDAVAEALQPPQAATRAATVSLYGLTRRERDILRLIAAGKSNQEIGDLLFVSPRTVSTHITAILAKLDAPSRTAAAAAAHRLGLL